MSINQFHLNLTGKLKHYQRKLLIDNLFTFVAFLKQLLDRSVYACGTVRLNCGLPNSSTLKEPGLVNGSGRWHHPLLLALAWQDTGLSQRHVTNALPGRDTCPAP